MTGGPGNRKWLLVKDFYLTIEAKAVVCAEAFKVVERVLTDSLRSTLGLKENMGVVLQLQDMVLTEADSLGFPENDNWWYDHLPFGVFASALLRIFQIDITKISIEGQKKKDAHVSAASRLFRSVLQDALDVLEEGTETLSVGHDDVKKSIGFMRKEENLNQVIQEFAHLARLRGARNKSAHPFCGTSSGEEMRAALDFYHCTLMEDYARKFRNVGYLGLLALNREVQSIDANVLRATEKMKSVYKSM